ncbi:Urease accessory protein UreF [Acetobacteraceae bacterium EV16G]|uniref:Urease accessory protein UreF n=1 Tax=Sorlinia euscelidii TaxID=3081148 RepID=A0ABU7U0W3_9PROT
MKQHELDSVRLLRLLNWVSPALPIGSFAYSHGTEWAVEKGDIRDAETLTLWVRDLLHHGSFRVDLAAVLTAWRAEDDDAARSAAAHTLAQASSRERWEETLQQGKAFLRAVYNWPDIEAPQTETRRLSPPPQCPLPVAFGLTCRQHGFDEQITQLAYAHCAVSAVISACARLIPLGQTEALRVLAALEDEIVRTIARMQNVTLNDVGSICFASDLAAMLHETQKTRLFRT